MPQSIPQLFELYAAAPKAVRLLSHALQQGRVPQALVIAGPQAAPTAALCQAWLAAVVCLEPQSRPSSVGAHPGIIDGCGRCAGCREYRRGSHLGVTVVDANERQMITVHDVREAAKKLQLRPFAQGRNVLFIDGAHMLNVAAQNALLKTLEEPPGQSCIILHAKSTRTLLPTVLSRLVKVLIAPPPQPQSVTALTHAGIDSPYAELLALRVGTNVAEAQRYITDGFVQVERDLKAALTYGVTAYDSHTKATPLAQNAAHFDMVTALLEIFLRDALAHLSGVSAELMAQPGTANVLRQLSAPHLCLAIDQVMLLRRQRKLNINRAQALEGLFVTLNHSGLFLR